MASRMRQDDERELSERILSELSDVTLDDRYRGALGSPLELTARDGSRIAGTLSAVGATWLAVAEGSGHEALVPAAAVAAVRGLGRHAAAPPSRVYARLGLGHALRAVAAGREVVQIVHLGRGPAGLLGTVDRVGRDYCEVTEYATGEQGGAGRGVVIPYGALVLVRTRR